MFKDARCLYEHVCEAREKRERERVREREKITLLVAQVLDKGFCFCSQFSLTDEGEMRFDFLGPPHIFKYPFQVRRMELDKLFQNNYIM